MRKLLAGIAAGFVASVLILRVVGLARGHATPTTRLVAEDASARLSRIAIHYAPAADRQAFAIWKQLFAVLPARVEVDVEVAAPQDFDRLMHLLAGTPHLERFHPVVVRAAITTWSRDRYAALVDGGGRGAILAPPRVETVSVARAGDARSPNAISRALYHRDARVADIVFEGGDLAATPHLVFADVNLQARNLGRAAADRPSIEHELHRRFAQQIVWLGTAAGDVPQHHIMMYMVPLDDHTVAVGDLRAGVALLGASELPLADVEVEARRFDRAAGELVARGFRVVRPPVVMLAGGRSYITYTNALFDRRDDGTRVVYMPTYSQPALDRAGAEFWRAQGYEVHPIDVTSIYRLNGSLGCLVNVLARD